MIKYKWYGSQQTAKITTTTIIILTTWLNEKATREKEKFKGKNHLTA
jgi:hypothetical protein